MLLPYARIGDKVMEIHISVRNLVEFILRSGDIDNRKAVAPENAMQEGSRIHRMLQRRMGADYHAEVGLKYVYTTEHYSILVDGRADGIIDASEANGNLVTIDEIKGTYRELHRIREAQQVHLAQASCYAYFYALQEKLQNIRIRITYCNIETEEVKYFHFEYTFEELEKWFENVMNSYRRWADFQYEWQLLRQQSIKELVFPFPYREGQKELVTYVYQTIYHKKKLFIEAPTGVGKTISTVFPSVKAMGEGMGQRIFYLTAKTITRTVANDTLALLRQQALRLKSVTITAKDKICFMEETECNPVACPYAKGHFDRINDAIYDLLIHEDGFDREQIEQYARKHEVCPFEMSLDMSLFADMIICDYNYLFDPHVYLKRFFSEGVREDYLFLIDEAHNLVERGREMYSATLQKEEFLAMKKVVKEHDSYISHLLERCNRELLELKRGCEEYVCWDEEDIAPFVRGVIRLSEAIDTYLEEHEESPVRKELLEFYFKLCHFLLIHELLDSNYQIYSRFTDENYFELKLFNVNPSRNLQECMMRGRCSVLFSATLLPIQYYKKLLGAQEGDYEVYARSVFDPEKRGLFIANDVTSKYSRRTDEEYYRIAAYVHEIIQMRTGNYMVFFPSHAFLRRVLEIYEQCFADEQVECLVQDEYMNERSREEFLARFGGSSVQRSAQASGYPLVTGAGFGQEADGQSMEGMLLPDGTVMAEPETGAISERELGEVIRMEITYEEDHTLLGFCVLGGIFSEGIDLKKDSLIGAIIVGTGLPMVCDEREILKRYFERQGDNGFDYAYRYPGMNKVLQAAGRVIRTSEDVGVVALLDERFLTPSYQRMFPREWRNYEDVSLAEVGHHVERFWDEWG